MKWKNFSDFSIKREVKVMIYFDNAATTFPKPECVWEIVNQFQRTGAVNVGRGGYTVAQKASDLIDSARNKLAKLVKASSVHDVYFTPSASVAANQIILSLPWDAHKVVYLSPFEHNAIARPVEKMRKEYGFKVEILPFSKETQGLDLEKMKLMFAKHPPDYLFINHMSNVTGAILPLETIVEEGKKYGACTIVDGCQSLGLIDYNLSQSSLDFLIFAGHKNLYASFGVGGFIKNSDFPLDSILTGGTGSDSLQLSMAEEGWSRYEFGSPNSVALASLDSSLTWLEKTGISTIREQKQGLMEKLSEGLKKFPVHCYIPEHWSHSILSFSHKEYTPQVMGLILDQDFEIAVRTGYHCAPYIHDLLDTRETQGTLRVNLVFWNKDEEIDRFLEALRDC